MLLRVFAGGKPVQKGWMGNLCLLQQSCAYCYERPYLGNSAGFHRPVWNLLVRHPLDPCFSGTGVVQNRPCQLSTTILVGLMVDILDLDRTSDQPQVEVLASDEAEEVEVEGLENNLGSWRQFEMMRSDDACCCQSYYHEPALPE